MMAEKSLSAPDVNLPGAKEVGGHMDLSAVYSTLQRFLPRRFHVYIFSPRLHSIYKNEFLFTLAKRTDYFMLEIVNAKTKQFGGC